MLEDRLHLTGRLYAPNPGLWRIHMLKKSLPILLNVIVLFVLISALPASANLLVNGNFEAPVIDPTSHCGAYAYCHGFHSDPTYPPSDSNIGGWTVIGNSDIMGCLSPQGCQPNGAPAPVMVMTNLYTEPFGATNNTLFFHVENGNQAIDLTGEGNQNGPGIQDGIKQRITTVVGGVYDLNFYLGHEDSSAPGYTTGDSTIQLYIDGVLAGTFSSGDNTPDDVSWKYFDYQFTASGKTTTIAFINDTAIGNNYAGLDNVNMTALSIPPGVPEPASLLLLATGLAALGLSRVRK